MVFKDGAVKSISKVFDLFTLYLSLTVFEEVGLILSRAVQN